MDETCRQRRFTRSKAGVVSAIAATGMGLLVVLLLSGCNDLLCDAANCPYEASASLPAAVLPTATLSPTITLQPTLRPTRTPTPTVAVTPTIIVSPTTILTPTTEPALPIGAVLNSSNMRSEPAIIEPETVIGQVCVGDEVAFLEERQIEDALWRLVRMTERARVCDPPQENPVPVGTEGWINARLLSAPTPVGVPGVGPSSSGTPTRTTTATPVADENQEDT